MVDASTATMTSSITTNYINEMPMINVGKRRQIIAYLKFLPGLSNYAEDGPSVDGAMRGSNEFFVDGAPASTQPNMQGGYGENSLAVEHVGEFNVVTNAFNAEYGRTGTWFASITTRSGTNQVHGSVFDYFANDHLNARGFFPSRRTVLRQNEAGFTLGGPVFIPKIYDGRNRTFFFFGQQLFYKRSLGTGELLTIPTMAFRTGDFSNFRDSSGNIIPIFDPASQRPDGKGGFVRDQFAGNQIPSSKISPISANIMALMPPPDLPNAQALNYHNRTGTHPRYDSFVSTPKIDHSFSDRQKLAVSYSRHYLPWIIAGRGWGVDNPLEGLQDPKMIFSRTGRISLDSIIGPTLLNHFTFGVNRYENVTQTKGTGQGWNQKLGLSGLPYDNGAIPDLRFSGGTAAPLRVSNPDWYFQGYTPLTFTENLTWIKGRHSLKFGAIYILETQSVADGRTAQGMFTFTNLQTSQPNAGSNLSRWGSATASFVLGAVSAGQTQNRFASTFIYPSWGLFAQDEWRVGKLTVSYGLRWEYSPAGYERFDRTSNFDPTAPNPDAGGITGAIVFAGTCSGCLGHRDSVDTWRRGFAPRLGLAYELNSKTVLRASGGIYYSVKRVAPGTTGYQVVPIFSSADSFSPAFNWGNGFPQNFKRPPVIDPSISNFQSTSYLSPGSTRLPQTLNWTFSLQRQLAATLALELDYVGSHTTHIANTTLGFPDIVNQSYLSLGSTLLQKINSAAAAAAGIKSPFPGFENSSYNTVAQALKPFPQYTSISGGDPIGVAHYNALHVKLNKRYANGLTSQVYYSWTKNISNADGGTYQYPLSPAGEMSISPVGPPHVFGASVSYELPFGPGKRFLTGRTAGLLAGGWEIAAFGRYSSGLPLTITVPNNLSSLGYPGKRATAVVGQPVHMQSNPRDFEPAKDRYLNSGAFSIPGSFQFGNTARVLDWARSWTDKTESISLSKRISIYERAHLVTRADFDNPFNFVRWSAPITDLSDANFGKVTASSPGRTIQISMSFEF